MPKPKPGKYAVRKKLLKEIVVFASIISSLFAYLNTNSIVLGALSLIVMLIVATGISLLVFNLFFHRYIFIDDNGVSCGKYCKYSQIESITYRGEGGYYHFDLKYRRDNQIQNLKIPHTTSALSSDLMNYLSTELKIKVIEKMVLPQGGVDH